MSDNQELEQARLEAFSVRVAPVGWFIRPEVEAVLRPREFPGDDLVEFAGLTVAEAALLLDLLAPYANGLVPDELPSLSVAHQCTSLLGAGATLSGYRVVPERDDERIAVTGLTTGLDTTRDELAAALAASGCPTPFHVEEIQGCWHVTWST
jgi:hypothetical protein